MKFKNIKKKSKKTQFPSNSRSIPARFKYSFPKFSHITLLEAYHVALKIFVVFIFIVAVIIVRYDLQKNLQTKQNIDHRREILIKKLKFWENFISKNQNYPDAYFQASILEYGLGDLPRAKGHVEKGLSLDPNSEEGRKIEVFLSGK